MVLNGLVLTKPKNLRPKSPSTRRHAPPKDSAARPSVSRADSDRQRSHVPHVTYDVMDDVILRTCHTFQHCDVMDDVIHC